MSIKVCDALCGSGKTSAAIKMMNERTDRKFVFVTQYLTEVQRIKIGCAGRAFVEPETNLECTTKLANFHELLRAGHNITTTHSLFSYYTEETIQLIKEQGYILVLDEVIDVVDVTSLSPGDLDILLKSGSVMDEGDRLTWVNDDYSNDLDGRFREEMMRAKSNNLLKHEAGYYCWVIPPELFTCFEEAYVLTYMFYAQPLRSFFDIYGLEYETIGTKRTELGFDFCPLGEMDRRRELRNKIHILEHKKLNTIGDKRNALSVSWYNVRERDGDEDISRIKKNLSNLFRNIWRAKAAESMWTTFKDAREDASPRGYGNSFVPYNKRASNEYANRKYLAYCVNNFPRPWEFNFYKERGSNMSSDGYALSILVQWIFRSAIRNNEEVWIYIPSARMRYLLAQWLDKLAVGEDLDEIKYTTPRKRISKKKRKNAKQSV